MWVGIQVMGIRVRLKLYYRTETKWDADSPPPKADLEPPVFRTMKRGLQCSLVQGKCSLSEFQKSRGHFG